MAAKSPFLGANRTTVWQILSTSAVVDTILFTYDKTESATIAGHPLKESIVLSMVSKLHNEALDTHFRTYLRNVDLTPIEQVYEDNSKDTLAAVAASVPTFVTLRPENAVSSKCELTAFEGAYTGDTGNRSTAASSLGDSPIEITAVSSSKQLTIDPDAVYTAYSDFLATGLTTITIETDTFGTTVWATSV